MGVYGFHPVIEEWFSSRFDQPTEPQQQGWPSIIAGENTLIAAPTGSGKTLTAFLAVIDRLFKSSLAGGLPDGIQVVYVSPLRALSNDMHRNLETPLVEIMELAKTRVPDEFQLVPANLPAPSKSMKRRGAKSEYPFDPIRVGLRTGDTTSSQRAALLRNPPHILVTTPESLYLMLTARRGRDVLQNVSTVIVDEIHALVRDKRGSHLGITLERLEALVGRPPQRIGLSATQKPIERMAEFLVGTRTKPAHADASSTEDANGNGEEETVADCQIVDVGHARELGLAIEVPPSELGAVCTHEQWGEVHARVVELIQSHRSTLIFVNTRRLAERVTHQLTEMLGEELVGSHHGSLSAKIRLETEQKLKSGELKAVVATASLELGLDVGYIDLVIQLGSPRGIATLLQRIGRSGHSLGLVPKGRLFALTRDELFECMALIRAVRAGRLDQIPIPESPLDVLAQQVVAELSAQPWGTEELFEMCRRSYSYRSLTRENFNRTLEFLSEGISHGGGRSRVYLHHDRVNQRLRARPGAGIAATSNAGAIPEIGSFRVVAQPEGTVVGTVDEDFAIESTAGSVFLLGNTSWRIQNVRGGDLNVYDAAGAPPTIPFWRGEAPGRTLELSEEISALRQTLEDRLKEQPAEDATGEFPARPDDSGRNPKIKTSQELSGPGQILTVSSARRPDLEEWLVAETSCSEFAAEQAVNYAAAQLAAIGLLPTQQRIVFERFFDETGGMQMVVHAPFGSRINQAWGLAMRKRFCRSFDFELQATADDDGFILSLGPQHSFPLESMFPMLNPRNVQPLLEQAILAVPMFQLRWRWNVTRALLVMRRNNGKKVPPALQRFRADDLLTAVFPKLTGCQENVVGDIELPDHPLAEQTMLDCLHEALDVEELKQVLARVEGGSIEMVARDTREPSPFSYELLNSNPYAFLDGGEIQERRARAVGTRRSLTVESVSDLGALDPAAIETVVREAQPLVRNADELHDTLLSRIVLRTDENADWDKWYQELAAQKRAATIRLADGGTAWVAAERVPAVQAVFPEADFDPPITVPDGVRLEWTSTDARVAIVRGLIEISGPVTSEHVAQRCALTPGQASAALEALEGEGVVLRGRFLPAPSETHKQEDCLTESAAASEANSSESDRPVEWCHRRLLARIHRLTLEGLRKQIEPVGVDTFIRFLTRHHGLLPSGRKHGPNGLFETIALLQGLDLPAIAWEKDVLPARVEQYQGKWLDELCLTGEIGWGRLMGTKRNPDRSKPMVSLTRAAPLALFVRSEVSWLSAHSSAGTDSTLSSPAEQVYELLCQRGAMFATDLLSESRMLPAQLDEVLGELVTYGLVTADGFAGLRQLLGGKQKSSSRRPRPGRTIVRRRENARSTGRWSVWRKAAQDDDAPDDFNHDEITEHWAWQLLRRWGVVFRDLLTRETAAPAWFNLLQVYRRLEARGEIRGGRFIAGVAGEQYALGSTVRTMRQIRDSEARGETVVVSAADPLNVVGILTEHNRVPSIASNRVAYVDGVPVASVIAGEVAFLADVDERKRFELAEQLGVSLEKSAADLGTSDAAESSNGNGRRTSRRKSPVYPNNIPRPMIS